MGDSSTKFYVVWKGKEIGIFNSWELCKTSVNGFPDAKYKSFSSEKEAKLAFKKGRNDYYESKQKAKNNFEIIKKDIPFFNKGIAVDAACSDNPGKMEYRGIDLSSGLEIFHEKFEIGTNNIGEFLAIVHGLKYIGDNDRVIYSDSRIGISWVKQGKCKTQFNIKGINYSEIWKAIKDAESRLAENSIKHDILKWNTEKRGEIPADFGRK